MNTTVVDFVILGGGIAGLTAALELQQRGMRVAVLEKSPVVGGLARTLVRDGYRFDIGGHRFHSNNPEVIRWVQNLLTDDLRWVRRQSHIHLQNHFVPYPIKFPEAMTMFSPMESAIILLSYLQARFRVSKRQDKSFEDWVINRFGQKLYEIYFRPYTEKVWGMPPSQLSAEWAALRIGLPSVRKAVTHALFPDQNTPATAVNRFLYPRMGFGQIANALEKKFVGLGGTLLTQSIPQGIHPIETGYCVEAETPEQNLIIFAPEIISTIPLSGLFALLPTDEIPAPQMQYRGLITVMLALNKPQVQTDTWTYFPSPKLIFGRIHEPKNWSAEMVPDSMTTSLVAEIFATPGDNLWSQTDRALIDKVIQQLTELNWLHPDQVIGAWALRIPHAYPVYGLDYARKRKQTLALLDECWPGLHLLGRTGSFRYINTDGVVESVFSWLHRRFSGDAHIFQALIEEDGRWV